MFCKEYNYDAAIEFLYKGQYAKAYYILSGIVNYEKAEKKVNELLELYPFLNVIKTEVGKTFVLGEYEQNNNLSDGMEQIEWIVFENENGVIRAVSKYVLDSQVYNTANGEGSYLKGWLKNDFKKVVFEKIEDPFISKVSLLRVEDMCNYHKIIGTKPEWTNYAMAKNPEKHYNAGYSWWLNEDFFIGYLEENVLMHVVIESGGYEKNVSPVTGINGVRPVIYIDLLNPEKDYYSSDYEEINNAGIVTRTKDDVKRIGGANSNGTNR